MDDREKVIKGLEIHADRSDKTDCDDCLYSKDDFTKGDCIGQLCSDALTLLKEQDAEIKEKNLRIWELLCERDGDDGK